MWNTDGEMSEDIWTGHSDWVMALSWSPSGGHIASGSSDGTILIRQAGKGLLMTPRPFISSSSRRPSSAFFLGSLPHNEDSSIPDLPEPTESPGAASTSSGLPSPPATNSTGSSSTGDNKSATAGCCLRQ
ncbi:hypothetical protein K503DRAFT_786963 [Rhizopogon vinicolor AM-OR11-026]|uniref:Uncharacterized protein n=1 Tax=Rhizopogon vinicolor AM-OR11-026 TaxID=1314800 RepID=A0A1B7MJK2_9AGAM|nr:hypothetical protein K503DRAFT_786963 [Rhizopogon vinicolor AM-OR11-026]